MKWPARDSLRFTWPLLWFITTFSLSAWWMVLGLNQTNRLSSEVPLTTIELAKQHRMFFWEGSFLLAVILIGGAALFYLVYLDRKKNHDLRQFFSSFTHELKTSLTSLRLQAEILEEDPKNAENTNLRRLLRDIVRLELQLENALILAQAESRLILEHISLKKIVQTLSVHWPQLKIQIKNDASILADQRALECIFKNLFQNSAIHGEAQNLIIESNQNESGIQISISDDGRGFANPQTLGKAFMRHTTRSGSGIGLHLSRILAKRMGGNLNFSNAQKMGFKAELQLGGHLK